MREWLATGLRRRMVDLNRGPFNGIEAAFYEFLSAPAVRAIVSPVLVDTLHGVDGVVLDVGCGSGDVTRDLRVRCPDVIGADPSVPQLRRLRRRNVLPCVAAPADALPFPSATFGAVVSSCSVKHWPSLASGLAECGRVLSPGGVLVIVEIDAGQHDEDLLRFAARTRVPPGLRRGYRSMARRSFVPLTPEPAEVEAVLTEAGLQRVAHRRIEGLPFFIVTAHAAGAA